MKNHQQPKESTIEQKRQRLTGRNVVIVAVILAVSLGIGSAPSSNSNQLDTRSLLWAVVATIGILAFMVTMVVDYSKADERQRHIQLQATAVAFIVVIMGLFAAEMAHALFNVNMAVATQVLFIGGIVIWSFARMLLERRNRV